MFILITWISRQPRRAVPRWIIYIKHYQVLAAQPRKSLTCPLTGGGLGGLVLAGGVLLVGVLRLGVGGRDLDDHWFSHF